MVRCRNAVLFNIKFLSDLYLVPSASPCNYSTNIISLTRKPGQFPGPTIEARSGDELIINVYNSVENSEEEEGISIHWHGLSMKGKPAPRWAASIGS